MSKGAIRGRALGLLIAVVAVTVTLVATTTGAYATAPGGNGRIVFRRFLDVGKTRAALFTVNVDGTRIPPGHRTDTRSRTTGTSTRSKRKSSRSSS